jgi:hypothetical protein
MSVNLGSGGLDRFDGFFMPNRSPLIPQFRKGLSQLFFSLFRGSWGALRKDPLFQGVFPCPVSLPGFHCGFFNPGALRF